MTNLWFKWLFIPTPTEENFSPFNLFYLERGCFESTREMEPELSIPPRPLLRLSAFLFDLSLHLKNLKLIFPSWTKLEEGRCFIKRFSIPPASTVFFIYIQRNSVFLFLRKCFQKLSVGKVNSIVLSSKKRKREKMVMTTP